jgi:fumarate hydratase subunit beta
MPVEITTPFTDEVIDGLRAGERVLLSGVIYTGRDAAHKRMFELLDGGEPLPFPVTGQVIYYTGPCPAPPGRVIGSAGPTTSIRMDKYSPRLIGEGLRVMLGKGERGNAVVDAIKRHKGLYLTAVGGAGALIAGCVEEAASIAFEDLGPEAVYRLVVRSLPLVVAIDGEGGSIFRRQQLPV